MSTILFIVDPQNDFCDTPEALLPLNYSGEKETPSLAIVGSHQNMMTLSSYIEADPTKFEAITVTLDCHTNVAIERPAAWVDAEGNNPPPFSSISYSDILNGRFRPAYFKDKGLYSFIISQVKKLNDQGGVLTIWPDHCVIGTWGHNVHPLVAKALRTWELATGKAVQFITKGIYQWSEHYGAFEAEVKTPSDPRTLFNEELASHLLSFGRIEVAGLASSHCVRASMEQYLNKVGSDLQTIALLTDCMNPVAGFEQVEQEFFDSMKQQGLLITTTEEISNE